MVDRGTPSGVWQAMNRFHYEHSEVYEETKKEGRVREEDIRSWCTEGSSDRVLGASSISPGLQIRRLLDIIRFWLLNCPRPNRPHIDNPNSVRQNLGKVQ